MKVKIKKLREDAKLPTYATDGSAGLDLYVGGDWVNCESVRWDCCGKIKFDLLPGESILIWTGVAIEIPEGYEGQIRPRSGTNKEDIHVFFGTIDSDYRGEVKVRIKNIGNYGHVFSQDDRIAQLLIKKVEKIEWDEVEELSETKRGNGGFGSTGR